MIPYGKQTLDEDDKQAVMEVLEENTEHTRDEVFTKLKEAGIGVNVHYMPIYLHSYYQSLGYERGLCPEAEKVYEQIITLPIYPLLKDEEVETVCEKITSLVNDGFI